MHRLPNLLSLFRIAMVPVLFGLAWSLQASAFLLALGLSLSSDVADGFLARRFQWSSPLGAKLDSWGDLLTYAAGIPCVLFLWPDTLLAEATTVLVALAAWLGPMLVGFVKFRALTSYHTWGAKLSAVLMPLGLVLLLFTGEPLPFRLATGILLLAAIDEIAITWRLSAPRQNVPSLFHV